MFSIFHLFEYSKQLSFLSDPPINLPYLLIANEVMISSLCDFIFFNILPVLMFQTVIFEFHPVLPLINWPSSLVSNEKTVSSLSDVRFLMRVQLGGLHKKNSTQNNIVQT